ncbi:MAG: UvrD-helicase domain-containing protein [Acidimicrobiia bacterium]
MSPAPEAALRGLNPVQLEAVTAPDGPVLVVAGAGSGKTRVLTSRIGHLISTGRSSPFGVLAITFTNKAADEMKDRVATLVGSVAASMWVSTFHSACARILRQDAGRVGLRSSFSIYDTADSSRVVASVLDGLGLDAKRHPPRQVLAAISSAKNELLGPDELADRARGSFERWIAEVYREYARRLAAAGALDFDDLLLRCVDLLRQHPESRDRWRARFRFVLVDEFQDTNLAQWELVRLLAEEHRNVMAVGDADQAIYRFRGADYRNLARFEEAFPEASVIVMDQNYRSTQTVLSAANAVIANNTGRHPKKLWTEQGSGEPIRSVELVNEREEANFVASEIVRLVDSGGRYGDIAVFYRTNAQSRAIEETMVRSGIPYRVVGGPKFYERKEVRDVLGYLRVLVNPDDELSWRRVVNVPRRGVGDVSLARVEAYGRQLGLGLGAALAVASAAEVTGRALAGIESLLRILEALVDAAQGGVAETVEATLELTGYRRELEAEHSVESQGRLENLRELIGVAREFDEAVDDGALTGASVQAVSGALHTAALEAGAAEIAGENIGSGQESPVPVGVPRIQAFLEAISLVTDLDDTDPASTSTVTLMTLHSAKGLEFAVVFLTGLEEGIFPHSRTLGEPDDLDEERRLCYVGITRAEERLYLTHTGSRSLFGTVQWYRPSRFLDEIPSELMVESRPGGSASERASGVRPGLAGFVAAGRSAGGSSGSGARGAQWLGLGVGDDVVHESFGEGVIVKVWGEGEKAEAAIRFSDGRERRLLLAWSPLRRPGS